MKLDEAIARLRAAEPELRAAGVVSLSVFGSVARDDAHEDSDVDVVVRLTAEAEREGFAWFGRIDGLAGRLRNILGRHVDVVAEPVRKEHLRRAIEAEGARAF